MWGSRSNPQNSNSLSGRHFSKSPNAAVCAGTEAEAKRNQEHNARTFRYPAAGFVTPIEYTLLHAMLAVPTVYPESVMFEQDFSEFIRFIFFFFTNVLWNALQIF
jgi:hypothetical protein